MLRRVCKWTLTVLLVLVVLLEVASVWWRFSWAKYHDTEVPDGDSYSLACIDRGALVVYRDMNPWGLSLGVVSPPLPDGLAVLRTAITSPRPARCHSRGGDCNMAWA